MDQEKQCRDCGGKFIFTEGEQRFFEEKQYTPPNRCKPCRDKRKLEKQGHVGGSPSKPILEYVNRPPAPVIEAQPAAPPPDRTFRNPSKNKYGKNDSRRRKHQQDDGDMDW